MSESNCPRTGTFQGGESTYHGGHEVFPKTALLLDPAFTLALPFHTSDSICSFRALSKGIVTWLKNILSKHRSLKLSPVTSITNPKIYWHCLSSLQIRKQEYLILVWICMYTYLKITRSYQHFNFHSNVPFLN